jgi:hypothetical protein
VLGVGGSRLQQFPVRRGGHDFRPRATRYSAGSRRS